MTRRFWVGLRAGNSGDGDRNERAFRRALAGGGDVESRSVRFRDAGRIVGRLAVLLARGARSVATRNLNMFTLIAMGVGVAYRPALRVPAACSRRASAAMTARRRSISRRPA